MRRERLRKIAIYAVVLVSVLFAAHKSDVRPGELFDASGITNAKAILSGFAHPDLSSAFLARILRLSIESIFIGLLATVMAVICGATLALAAIRVPRLPEASHRRTIWTPLGGALRLAIRTLFGVLRSIPDIVWAYLFVRILGLGPGPGVLALAVANTGIVGKLFAELAEAVDPEPVYALRRAGVGRLGCLFFGVVPQVWRQWTAYSFLRLECSIRSATILGVVGAGGLGTEIALAIRYFQYDKLAPALVAVLLFVIATELASSFLRRKHFKWTLWFAAVGMVLSIHFLDIPWSALLSSKLIPRWLTYGSRSHPLGFLSRAIVLAGQTVAMAWCGTVVAAVFALILSAGATTTFLGDPDALRGRGDLRSKVRWAIFVVSRLILQACRAVPELTLALIFVVWVGPGPFAGALAVGVHTIGVLGRMFTDVYDDANPKVIGALAKNGTPGIGLWLYGLLPQSMPKLIGYTLYRFEVNVRAAAMVGFVGAGGIGNAIDTAISMFHGQDLVMLLAVLIGLVMTLDVIGDRVRYKILTARFRKSSARSRRKDSAPDAKPRQHLRRDHADG